MPVELTNAHDVAPRPLQILGFVAHKVLEVATALGNTPPGMRRIEACNDWKAAIEDEPKPSQTTEYWLVLCACADCKDISQPSRDDAQSDSSL
jgi:hypothetical protein